MPLTTKYGLDLDAAWKRALRRAHKAEVPDLLRWEDYQLLWEEWRELLIERLEGDTYTPSQPRIVEVPKDGYAVRPVAVLDPMDHVVLEAVVGSIASEIDSMFPSGSVFSSRFKMSAPATYELEDQGRAWLKFQDAARDLYDSYDEAFMLTTDVASFYEYVDLEILGKEIKAISGVPEQNANLLSRILNSFQRSSDIWGLPQGIAASGILGNLYLLPVDRCLDGLPVTAIRFGDDMKIFGEHPRHLRRALSAVTRTMRNRHLNIAISKTKLLEGTEILDEIEDTKKDAIQYGIESGAEGTLELLKEFFDEAVAENPVSGRDVRFAVYRLQKAGDPHAVPWILSHIAEVPYLAQLLVDYLSSQLQAVPDIEVRVRDFLGDPDLNIYPYVEMQLIRMLSRAGSIDDETLTVVKTIADDANKETYVREHAIRCRGQHARVGDSAKLRTDFNNETHHPIKRALLIAATVSLPEKDNGWLKTVEESLPDLASTARFLRVSGSIPDP